MDAIKTIPEHTANARTQAIYADIRHTLGVSTVNLVWRHLASIEHGLPWVWSAVKPLYARPGLRGLAASLRDLDPYPSIPPLRVAERARLGMDASALDLVDAILAHYEQSNPLNLVVLLSVSARLRGLGRNGELPHISAPPVRRFFEALPQLIPEDAMSSTLARAARRFEVLGTGSPIRPILAGVPRHLAHWPTLLEFVVTQLQPHETALAHAISTVQTTAMGWAQVLANELDLDSKSPVCDAVLSAIDRFTAVDLIANYVVKVEILRHLLFQHPTVMDSIGQGENNLQS